TSATAPSSRYCRSDRTWRSAAGTLTSSGRGANSSRVPSTSRNRAWEPSMGGGGDRVGAAAMRGIVQKADATLRHDAAGRAVADNGRSTMQENTMSADSLASLAQVPGVAPRDPATREFLFNHTMLRVKDPRASLDFYTRVLGFSLVRKNDYPENWFSL